MMTRVKLILCTVTLCAAALDSVPACAQSSSINGPSNYNPGASNEGPNQAQQDSDRIYREVLTKQRSTLQKRFSSQKIMDDSTAAANGLQLSCNIQDAQLASENKMPVNGHDVTAFTYEIACADGMGYFVVSQNPEPPVGYSCFTIEGQRAAAAAKGQKFEEACVLPENKDLRAVAGDVMRNLGTTCKVTRLQWMGQDDTKHSEYTEAACNDGKGYILATALPGSPMQGNVIPCSEANGHGLACRLTNTATASAAAGSKEGSPTVDDFKTALTQHGVACTVAADTDIRLIGKQNKSQRHVVEFKCPEQPKGLVVLIPLGSNSSPFQTMDCAAAAKIGAACKLQGS
ncbi:MAG TPA: hypothetical protein VGM17_05960 [Rhizomicrobium sp.]|jgi:hypothetical protein